MRLSVIIAAYNEERTVTTIVDRVRSVPLDIDIVVHHDRNRGKGAALRTGIAAFAALWHIVRFNLLPPTQKIAFRPSPSAATD